jgi:hypothetical protein
MGVARWMFLRKGQRAIVSQTPTPFPLETAEKAGITDVAFTMPIIQC